MDPNANLTRIRELTLQTLGSEPSNMPDDMLLDELAEHVQALDAWLTSGGFLPAAWAANCDFDRQMREQHLRRRAAAELMRRAEIVGSDEPKHEQARRLAGRGEVPAEDVADAMIMRARQTRAARGERPYDPFRNPADSIGRLRANASECPDCYGSGVHRDELCPTCKGRS